MILGQVHIGLSEKPILGLSGQPLLLRLIGPLPDEAQRKIRSAGELQGEQMVVVFPPIFLCVLAL
jgi:hypothetical protein